MVRTAQQGLQNWVTDATFSSLSDGVLRAHSNLILVEDATNQTIAQTTAYGINTFVINVNSKNTAVINVDSDNIMEDSPQFTQNGGSMTVINTLRYNGYSYELIAGKINLYNRIAVNEVGERTVEKSK